MDYIDHSNINDNDHSVFLTDIHEALAKKVKADKDDNSRKTNAEITGVEISLEGSEDELLKILNSIRNQSMYDQFQKHVRERENKLKAGEDCSSKFVLKVMNYKESLYEVINFYDTLLPKKVNEKTVTDCFVRCGLVPKDTNLSNGYHIFHQFDLDEHKKAVELKVPPIYLIDDVADADDAAEVNMSDNVVDLVDYLDDAIDVVLPCDDEAEYIDDADEDNDRSDDENYPPSDQDDAYSCDEADEEDDV